MHYSGKNIPLPSCREYTKILLEKVESVIKRMRWKAFFFLNNDDNTEESTNEDAGTPNETYGLKSKRTPPVINEMIKFEQDMLSMVENIEFRQVKNTFQSKLTEDVKKITSSDCIFVEADKTRNMYKMDVTDYNKLLTENITQKYKLADPGVVTEIDAEFNSITEKLNISERIDKTSERQAFITLKDHKESFATNTKCRLINPTKTELGRVSKIMLDSINAEIRRQISVNQWMNTTSVLEWFNNLHDKKNLSFLVFDIVEFYPSISEELLTRCLSWARQYATIKDTERDTIMHARRSLLYHHKGTAWEKRDTNKQFDVPMGAYDGAEVCELVGLYILSEINCNLDFDSVGLYRDDGLAVVRSHSGRRADCLRKDLIRIFQSCGLSITVQTNLKSVSFLDTTLDLNTGEHQPYKKPNDDVVYIDYLSNHPPTIIKNLPPAIGKRISELSSTKDIFKKAAPTYNEALKSSGYGEAIEYNVADNPTTQSRTRRKKRRHRQTIWFNPPFSRNVKSNIGNIFLKLIGKHFPRGSNLHKIFNKNNLKISYSCMKNINSIIKSHNTKIMKKSEKQAPAKSCNCRDKTSCPLRGECLSNAVVYKATVLSDNTSVSYIGLSGGSFKTRYGNHTKSFKHERYEKETELSKYVWGLKRRGAKYYIHWEIVKKSDTNRRGSGTCNLCLEEKLAIISKDDKINKRAELISTCRHNKRKKPADRARKR